MTTELEAAVRRLEAVAEGGLVNTGGDESITLAGDITTVLAALSSPPTDDVREEAERRWPVMVIGYTDSDGSRFEYESTENRQFREAFIAGAEFEVRPRGPVTDAPTRPQSEGGVWGSYVEYLAQLEALVRGSGPVTEQGDRSRAENTQPTTHTDRSAL